MARDRTIANSGSAARDHLANERTFLAWVRTALGIVGLGVLVVKVLDIQSWAATVAGMGLIGLGAVSLAYGSYRYMQVASRLTEGRFPVARRGPMLLGGLSLAAVLGGLAWLFVR